jgi:hypothetical protein
MYSLDEAGHTPPIRGGVVDLLKATRGARTKFGKTAPFTRSCADEAVGISPPPKRRTKFSRRPFDARADPYGSTDVIDEILMRGNWPEEGGVR